jgi:hypothetical protein
MSLASMTSWSWILRSYVIIIHYFVWIFQQMISLPINMFKLSEVLLRYMGSSEAAIFIDLSHQVKVPDLNIFRDCCFNLMNKHK